MLHVDQGAEAPGLITWAPEDQETVAAQAHRPDFRVSALADKPDWSLVEFRAMMTGYSPLASMHSDEMQGTDIYFFRRTGSATEAHQHDLHHYRNGQQRRRVFSHCTIPREPAPEPWSEGAAEGDPLIKEQPSRPPDLDPDTDPQEPPRPF